MFRWNYFLIISAFFFVFLSIYVVPSFQWPEKPEEAEKEATREVRIESENAFSFVGRQREVTNDGH